MFKSQNRIGDIIISLAIICVFLFMFRLWPLILIVLAVGLVLIIKNVLFPKRATQDGQTQQQPIKNIAENCDEWEVKYAQAGQKISEFVQEEYPSVQWVYESPNWKSEFQNGADLYIRLNKEGGYKRVKVSMQDWCVCGVEIIELPQVEQEPETETRQKTNPSDENKRIAYEWVETHLLQLNDRCNEVIGQGNEEWTLLANELPDEKCWDNICQELIKAGLEQVEILPEEGIKITLK